MEKTGIMMVTEEEYDAAIHAEIESIRKEHEDKPVGALMLAMGGAAFAHAVWLRLTGERK